MLQLFHNIPLVYQVLAKKRLLLCAYAYVIDIMEEIAMYSCSVAYSGARIDVHASRHE